MSERESSVRAAPSPWTYFPKPDYSAAHRLTVLVSRQSFPKTYQKNDFGILVVVDESSCENRCTGCGILRNPEYLGTFHHQGWVWGQLDTKHWVLAQMMAVFYIHKPPAVPISRQTRKGAGPSPNQGVPLTRHGWLAHLHALPQARGS